MMAGIRGRNTRPEMALRQALHARGLRFRLHDRRLPGTPMWCSGGSERYVSFTDASGTVMPAAYATVPAARTEFWLTKFAAKVKRDRSDWHNLLHAGWRVAVIWECALRREIRPRLVSNLERWLRGCELEFETEPSSLSSKVHEPVSTPSALPIIQPQQAAGFRRQAIVLAKGRTDQLRHLVVVRQALQSPCLSRGQHNGALLSVTVGLGHASLLREKVGFRRYHGAPLKEQQRERQRLAHNPLGAAE